MNIDLSTMSLSEQCELARQLLYAISENGATPACLVTDLRRMVYNLTPIALNKS